MNMIPAHIAKRENLQMLVEVVGDVARDLASSEPTQVVTHNDGVYKTVQVKSIRIHEGGATIEDSNGAEIPVEADTQLVCPQGMFYLSPSPGDWTTPVAPPADGGSYTWSYNQDLSEDVWTPVPALSTLTVDDVECPSCAEKVGMFQCPTHTVASEINEQARLGSSAEAEFLANGG